MVTDMLINSYQINLGFSPTRETRRIDSYNLNVGDNNGEVATHLRHFQLEITEQ